MKRMNEIVKMIRANGSADLVLEGDIVTVGFQGAGTDGRKFNIAKGELVKVIR
jgi:hypothetical protein